MRCQTQRSVEPINADWSPHDHFELSHLNEPAPDFKALTTHGERSLADCKGKWLILFSHPADFTPVCTTEFIGFAKAADQFRTMNCELLGLGAHVQWLLETHVHADHLSAAPYLQRQLGGQIGIGSHIVTVQETFGKLFNAGTEFQRDGSQFDRLFEDGDRFTIGDLPAQALHTPGHTPACMTYVVDDDDALVEFVGDTLFMPDYGTARCDFPGGDAAVLFRSIRKVLARPPQTRLYMCHDYAPGGRPVQHVSTVAEQRAANVHVNEGVNEAEFVAMRRARDATLAMPQLILPSVQVNMRAGQLPPAENNGLRYLKIPIDAL